MIICIDLDGTLLDVSRRHHIAMSMIAAVEYGFELGLSRATYWQQRRHGFSDASILASVGLRVDERRYGELKRVCVELPALLDQDVPFPFAVPALARLRMLGRLFLVSHREPDGRSLAQLRRLELSDFFDEVCFGTAAQGGKAALIRSRLPQIEPSQTVVVIGDSEADLEAARALGVRVMLVESGVRDREFLIAACGHEELVYPDLAACAEALAESIGSGEGAA